MDMNKKRMIALVLAVVFVAGLFSGCSNVKGMNKKSGKYRIVCTIFPEYDWAKQIIGENNDQFELTLLLDNGVDLHSYQPTAEDILTISTCDVFVYVGGESDAWVKDALKESMNKEMKVINLMEILGEHVKEEEVVEGMQKEDEEEAADEEENEAEYDEHVWLSVKNAKILISSISETLQEVDEENKEVYIKNTENYLSDLEELDGDYQSVVKDGTKDTLLFGDRFPFRYMTDDYDLKYYAAFVGCSAETEAGFDTIIFLAEKMDELDLNCIIVTESSDEKLARTIISNTKDKNQKVIKLDSMQSATKKDIDAGTTYLSVMTKNLEILKDALE